ncbi:UbiA family prenyltransferase [Polymorphobacter arshaanensis]|uniref:UbiA family prenyltransferase n=1 Tax=Glacieibacterium arshaanense TaxID=2511025 RepID=A0A4Y9EMF0_9SPHN|nr:UbiA family prenyltransferase [Polymorphobacter arshaanensis]TFU03182.1 UbiA family prenyltransferase [Polymorphobacter arshaanensis]
MNAPVPLAVDVDGTLLMTDLLHESALQFVARHPFQTPRLFGWLTQGKAALKAQLADRVDPGVAALPLRPEVVALIRTAQAEGRPVYLASASDSRLVEALADHIGGIAGVIGSDGTTNMAGEAKAAQLVARFGRGGFDYVGDTAVDLPVWAAARQALVVARSPRLAALAAQVAADTQVVATPHRRLKDYVRAIRPHQWAKNSLVFLAMFAGHKLSIENLILSTLAFVCFCTAASSAYVVNDLLDLPGDRAHPRKARRPFASGALPVLDGVVLAAAMMALTIGVVSFLPPPFMLVLAVYVATTLGYSMVFKRYAVIDVIVLGGLYTIRVVGGVVVIRSSDAQWLLMFSLFLFLSLAIIKRCSELVQLRERGIADTPGRGYRVSDLAVLQPMAAAAGYGAVLLSALYVSSSKVARLYEHPKWLWLICPFILYWISRVMVLSGRGELHDDPVLFAITDRLSWLTAAAVVAVVLVSA